MNKKEACIANLLLIKKSLALRGILNYNPITPVPINNETIVTITVSTTDAIGNSFLDTVSSVELAEQTTVLVVSE